MVNCGAGVGLSRRSSGGVPWDGGPAVAGSGAVDGDAELGVDVGVDDGSSLVAVCPLAIAGAATTVAAATAALTTSGRNLRRSGRGFKICPPESEMVTRTTEPHPGLRRLQSLYSHLSQR